MINAEHTHQHMNNVTHEPQKLVYEWEEQPIISKEHHRSSGYQAPTTDRKRQKSQRASAGERWITIATNPARDQREGRKNQVREPPRGINMLPWGRACYSPEKPERSQTKVFVD